MAQNHRHFSSQKSMMKIVPLYWKIVLLFVFFLLVTNFATNYINLILNRAQNIKLMNQLLVKELKENYIFSNNQYEIYSYDQNLKDSQTSLIQATMRNLTRPNSLALGTDAQGKLLFFASPNLHLDTFPDHEVLVSVFQNKRYDEGPIEFMHNGHSYFGYYKFHPGWQVFMVRAEDKELFYAESTDIFWNISLLIVAITLTAALLGIFLLRYQFRYIGRITSSLIEMQKTQELGMIDLKGAPGDDITYLGLSFNMLSVTIRNLIGIFRKFVTQDVAYKAYKEKQIRLEGKKEILTILFSDIKGFTYMTETLGNDIIKLLNLHYDKAIRKIQEEEGIVGSIIGDALLAVFGTIETAKDKHALKALRAAYAIQKVAATLRELMILKKEEIIQERGQLTNAEEQVFKAVMIEIGVGIDGGEVFYGNIGSYVRMTNTVIGDNVNSASRLEGLTRIYKVPVIVSEFVKNEVLNETDEYIFVELDKVQVKGKTEGKRIFWPVLRNSVTQELQKKIASYDEGLQSYYAGDWKSAVHSLKESNLPQAEVFLERITGGQPPKTWNGVWTLANK